jgi:hypothetical protein
MRWAMLTSCFNRNDVCASCKGDGQHWLSQAMRSQELRNTAGLVRLLYVENVHVFFHARCKHGAILRKCQALKCLFWEA